MDTSDQENYNFPIKEFLGKKQSTLFNIFKGNYFSGELTFVNPNGPKWRFYMSMGRLVYATGGEISVRRWRRYLAIYLSNIAHDTDYLQKEIASISTNKIKFCWEYELLRKWMVEGKTDRDSVMKMVSSIIIEILFDLNQCSEVIYNMDDQVNVPMEEQICLFDSKDLIISAWKQWQKWVNAGLGDRSPNKSPIIRSHQQLQAKLNPQTYELFVKLFNGRNTLRDLSVKLKKDIYQLSSYILPYIQEGYVELIPVEDLPAPIPEA